MPDMLGVGVTKVNGRSEDAVTDTPRIPIPLFKITCTFEQGNKIGQRNQSLVVTVQQAGKDAAWALHLATNNEFCKFIADGWVIACTEIEQIGME